MYFGQQIVYINHIRDLEEDFKTWLKDLLNIEITWMNHFSI